MSQPRRAHRGRAGTGSGSRPTTQAGDRSPTGRPSAFAQRADGFPDGLCLDDRPDASGATTTAATSLAEYGGPQGPRSASASCGEPRCPDADCRRRGEVLGNTRRSEPGSGAALGRSPCRSGRHLLGLPSRRTAAVVRRHHRRRRGRRGGTHRDTGGPGSARWALRSRRFVRRIGCSRPRDRAALTTLPPVLRPKRRLGAPVRCSHEIRAHESHARPFRDRNVSLRPAATGCAVWL